jgi:hypothetical protein
LFHLPDYSDFRNTFERTLNEAFKHCKAMAPQAKLPAFYQKQAA